MDCGAYMCVSACIEVLTLYVDVETVPLGFCLVFEKYCIHTS